MCTCAQMHISFICAYVYKNMYVVNRPIHRIHGTFVSEAKPIYDFSAGTQGRETSSTRLCSEDKGTRHAVEIAIGDPS